MVYHRWRSSVSDESLRTAPVGYSIKPIDTIVFGHYSVGTIKLSLKDHVAILKLRKVPSLMGRSILIMEQWHKTLALAGLTADNLEQ